MIVVMGLNFVDFVGDHIIVFINLREKRILRATVGTDGNREIWHERDRKIDLSFGDHR